MSGKGKCRVGDDIKIIEKGSFVNIPQNIKHRIENISVDEPLIIAEVQTGDILDESDIYRYDDDYGRFSENYITK